MEAFAFIFALTVIYSIIIAPAKGLVIYLVCGLLLFITANMLHAKSLKARGILLIFLWIPVILFPRKFRSLAFK
jgi:hypothetical protein